MKLFLSDFSFCQYRWYPKFQYWYEKSWQIIYSNYSLQKTHKSRIRWIGKLSINVSLTINRYFRPTPKNPLISLIPRSSRSRQTFFSTSKNSLKLSVSFKKACQLILLFFYVWIFSSVFELLTNKCFEINFVVITISV